MAQCPGCDGKGVIAVTVFVECRPYFRKHPCGVCQGQGVVHCCEGSRPDNEAETETKDEN